MGKKKTPTLQASGLDLASQVARRIQIRRIQLVDAQIVCNVDGEVSEKVAVSYDTKTTVDSKSLTVAVLMQTSVHDENDTLNIKATFRATYSIESLEGLTPECFDAFGNLNGLFNIWPFWREFIHNTTLRTGLPALVLPVQKPVANRQSADNRKSEKRVPRKK